MQLRAPITPDDVQTKSSTYLRDKLVIENLFQINKVTYVLSHHDRILIGGATLNKGQLQLEAPAGLSSEYLLERREMGLVCLSGDILVEVDGDSYKLKGEDILYLSLGSREIKVSGTGDIYFTRACVIQNTRQL